MHKVVGLSRSVHFMKTAGLKWGGFALGRGCNVQPARQPINVSGDRSEPCRRAAKPLASLLQLQKELRLVTGLVQFGEFSSRLKLISGLTGRGDSSNLRTAQTKV